MDKFIRWDVGSWINISDDVNNALDFIDLPNLGMYVMVLEQHRIKIVERTEYWLSKEFCCECDGADYFTPPSISCRVRVTGRTILEGPKIIRDFSSTQVRTRISAAGTGSITTDWEDKF